MNRRPLGFGVLGSLLAFLTGSASALTLTPSTDGTTLANAIIGPGVTITSVPSYVGAENQSASFTGGVASGVGFESGIVLTTGDATAIGGLNVAPIETRATGDGAPDLNVDIGGLGDADLTALAGYDTYDAAVLQFDFRFGDGTTGGNSLFVNFVFASEEYLDFVDTPFNDVFAFWVDGANIALVGGDPVTVNTLNDVANSAFYRNNVDNTNGVPNLGIPIRYDGLTTVITARATDLGPGTHTLKLAIADTEDEIFDAGVFIEGGTFSSEPPAAPEPSVLALSACLLLALALRTRAG